jgi:hypothetical protein
VSGLFTRIFGTRRRDQRCGDRAVVHSHPRRCPLNVAGPFYTTGDCLACEAPEAEAPELLAPLKEGNYTTYFVKQPHTAEEVERACKAIESCCVADLRYGGQDRSIIQRLGNRSDHSDFVLRDGKLILSEEASR